MYHLRLITPFDPVLHNNVAYAIMLLKHSKYITALLQVSHDLFSLPL